MRFALTTTRPLREQAASSARSKESDEFSSSVKVNAGRMLGHTKGEHAARQEEAESDRPLMGTEQRASTG
jgi:hypothetical protein